MESMKLLSDGMECCRLTRSAGCGLGYHYSRCKRKEESSEGLHQMIYNAHPLWGLKILGLHHKKPGNETELAHELREYYRKRVPVRAVQTIPRSFCLRV